MKLCVFQGTFNPIHKAHILMAEYVLEHYDFDKIIFIPAYKPPHKDYDETLSPHRLEMVKIATSANPKFFVSDIEYRREENSYTYNTIKELYEKYEIEGKIHFIIGTDAFEKIESWYKSDKLKELVQFIVFVRKNQLDESKFDGLKLNGYDFVFAQMPFKDISSTQIRTNSDISELVPEKVKDYIKENGLYKNK